MQQHANYLLKLLTYALTLISFLLTKQNIIVKLKNLERKNLATTKKENVRNLMIIKKIKSVNPFKDIRDENKK